MQGRSATARENSKRLFELILLTIFGVLMFATKIVMAVLPNVHLIGTFIMIFTISFRSKALIPIYVYVALEGFVYGFGTWWISYLYVWAVLWGMTMLLPKKMPHKIACVVYPIVAAFHGLIFGALCAPVEAIVHGFSFKQMLVWISMGLSFDITHAIGNFCFGLLILPLSVVLEKLRKKSRLA
jgi:energy-coupling factor transport system substrate-specific component